jgi:Leucine-rich repeat (LRR) protein
MFYIEKVAPDALDSLQHLQYLSIKKNLLTSIGAEDFKNLKNLSLLDLAANKIQEIHPHAFLNLTKLHELHLSQNLLRGIPEKLFIGMEKLKKLMMFSNDLRYLHAESFSGLRYFLYSADERNSPRLFIVQLFNDFSLFSSFFSAFFAKFIFLLYHCLFVRHRHHHKCHSALTNLLLNNNNLKEFDANVFAPLINLTKL